MVKIYLTGTERVTDQILQLHHCHPLKNFFDEHSTPLGEEETKTQGIFSRWEKPKIKISLVKVSSDFFHKI